MAPGADGRKVHIIGICLERRESIPGRHSDHGGHMEPAGVEA